MMCIGLIKLIGLQVLIIILFGIIYMVSGINTNTPLKASQLILVIWWFISLISHYLLGVECTYI